MLHRKIMWRDRYSATGCSPALQAVDSKQAENLLVGKTKSYWTNNRERRHRASITWIALPKDYGTAFLTHFGQWMQPARRRDKGPMPQPRWVPLPELLYAQVVKSYRRQRIVGVKYWVVFGTMERVQQVLSACGRKINTAFVERLNLDIRQRVAAVGRRVNTLCQGADGLRQQLGVYHVYDNFCLPHSS